MKIVVTRPIMEAGLHPLQSVYDVHVVRKPPEHRMDEDELIEIAREADALITLLSDPVTARVIEACPRLKIIAQYAVGYDNIDVAAAHRRGVIVTHTPGVLTDATADFAFALLLAVARRIPAADRYVREGRFKRWETMELLGLDLRGHTLGILGMGRIGLAVARRAFGFGMELVYHNRRRANPTYERTLGLRYVSFEQLLEESDVLSIHANYSPASHHLIDADAFRRMKPTALLVNTARGPIVDEEALVEALASGEIAGAGLDVFEREPQVHPGLFDHDRVVLAPHLGSATVKARTRMALMCSESVLAALDGGDAVPYRVPYEDEAAEQGV